MAKKLKGTAKPAREVRNASKPAPAPAASARVTLRSNSSRCCNAMTAVFDMVAFQYVEPMSP